MERFISIEKARAAIYNIFSALFCQPDNELIRENTLFMKLEQALQTTYPDLVSKTIKMKQAASDYSDNELLVEYARLFVGPFKTSAPPYSSIYLGSKDTIFSEETIWVIQFYRSAGLDFNIDIHDLPDHIAVESEFIYYLIFHEVQQLEENNQAEARQFHNLQSQFIFQHFNKWVPAFCEAIINESKNDYFRYLAICLKSFAEKDSVPEFP
jgi:TorA maturation chaperone TorD